MKTSAPSVRGARLRLSAIGIGTLAGALSGCPQAPQGEVLMDPTTTPTAACPVDGGGAAVAMPQFVRNLQTGETGWFSPPAVIDLDHDGKKEIVVASYSVQVFDQSGARITKGTTTKGRVYAPAVVGDLDGDGVTEVVVGGNTGTITAYEYKSRMLSVKSGWAAATTCSAGQCPETRGLAAADLDGDGKIEVVATTTQTAPTGAQVFVFNSGGQVFQPPGLGFTAWPRYNTAKGAGNDADFNGYGNHGYGCYGLNVGIGNIDDDAKLEILVTYDNHQLNAFKFDGTSLLASSYYTNPQNMYLGQRMGWGQFIRWFDPTVEDNHYNKHLDPWPAITTDMWLQFTASPPNVVDINGDGKNEVVALPNAELHDPYVTQGYAFFVVEGAYGDGSRAARRLAGFENLLMSDQPVVRAAGDYYPPDGVPAPTTVNIVGDPRPEIIAPVNDGYIYAVSADNKRLWRYNYSGGAAKVFASEVTVADLNKDGKPEIIFGVYSLNAGGGRLVILSNTGALLFDTPLPNQGMDGNGIGVPAAPTVADLDGDGTLEILVSTFDHGVDVFTVPGSGTKCALWPDARGNLLRNSMGPNTAK